MNPTAVEQHQQVFIKHKLMAASDTALPTRMEIIRAGKWENSWKGDLEILVTDLQEMKLNFDKGIGLPDGGSGGAPIDFSHEEWSKAAAWIKALEVDESAGILYASEIEWTTAGRTAVEGKEYKFFSPSVYPACLGTWSDPEDPTHTAQNVLLGGGLTNIPFFKGLTGLKASRTVADDGRENIIYFSEGESMDLSAVKAKNKEDLTAEEKTFLEEHKTELTADELVALGLEDAPATVEPIDPALVEPTAEEKEAASLQADIRSGKKIVVDAGELAQLKASVNANSAQLEGYRKAEVKGKVDAAVAAGKIKSDQADKWATRILADATFAEDLEALPENKLLAGEIGSDKNDASAIAEFNTKVTAHIKASREAGTEVSKSDAISAVRKANPDLAKSVDAEIKVSK